MHNYEYLVYFEKGMDGNIIADCPVFEGCHTQGKNIKEAKEKIKEVIELCIEEYIEEGKDLPSDAVFEKVKISI